MKKNLADKKKNLRRKTHLTRPPRMEGKVKNTRMNPVREMKKAVFHPPSISEPVYLASENGYKEVEDEEYGYNEEREY